MAKRVYGTGSLYIKGASYYARWRTADGRQLNRKVGPVRPPGEGTGLTRPQAEREFRRMQDEEERRPSPARQGERRTVDDAASSLRRQLALEGARKSYLENCESMQRVHLSPALGDKPIDKVTTAHIEALGASMLERGLAPKTLRNALTFTHSVFEHARKRGWVRENPARDAARPKRRRANDANPDLQSLPSRSSTRSSARSPTTSSCASRTRRAAAAEGRHRRPRPTCSGPCCASSSLRQP